MLLKGRRLDGFSASEELGSRTGTIVQKQLAMRELYSFTQKIRKDGATEVREITVMEAG